jgi:hypothetical protein
MSAGIQECDLECAVDDRSPLANELVEPSLGDRALAPVVDIATVRFSGWLAVEEDAEGHRLCGRSGTRDEVKVPRVEPMDDPPSRYV